MRTVGPDLRILGYHERKPMLRVVDVGEATSVPAPVSLDTGHALDRCWRREGWLAYCPNQTVWERPGEPHLVLEAAAVGVAGPIGGRVLCKDNLDGERFL